MWKEVAVDYFKAQPQPLPGMAGKYVAYLVTALSQPVFCFFSPPGLKQTNKKTNSVALSPRANYTD
jgi:hypothetical protein